MENKELQDDLVKPTEPTKTTKNINKIIVGALLVIAIGIGIILTWSLQSDDVLEVNKLPIPTRTVSDHPTAGGVVILNIDYCKKLATEGMIRTSFVSPSREVFLPISRERSPQGCRKTELPVLIPRDLPPDMYEIRLRATYDVNPLKQGVVEEFKSAKFRVDPSIVQNGE